MNRVSSSRRSAIFAAFSAQMTPTFQSSAAGLVALALTATLGCADPIDPKAPRPTLAATVPAGEAMAALRSRWAHGTRDERVALRPTLAELRARYGQEPIRRLLDLYDAWILLETGDLASAEAAARRLRLPTAEGATLAGNTDDLAQLVAGASLARRGETDQALDTLLPLLDRLLDPYARDLLHEEALEAALAGHRWADAIRVLEAYQRDIAAFSGDSTLTEAAERRIEAALKAIPGTALEGALQRYRDTERLDAPLARKLSARLAAIAVARGDTPLAQRLVQTQRQSDLATLGDQRQSLLELASAHVGSRVVGHTVGLVLRSGDDEARLRAASLAFGAAAGASALSRPSDPLAPSATASLGTVSPAPPGSSSRPAGAEAVAPSPAPLPPPPLPPLPLTTALLSSTSARADGAPSLDTPTLRALLQRGTLLLVGGDTPQTARELARFADEHEIPVLLLANPAEAAPSAVVGGARREDAPVGSPADSAGPWSVVFGPVTTGEHEVRAALRARGATRIGVIGGPAPSASASPPVALPPAAPSSSFASSAPGAPGSPPAPRTPSPTSAPADADGDAAELVSPCPDLSLHVQGTYPFADWERAGVSGVLLRGSDSCTRRALDALAARRRTGSWSPLVGFTLISAASIAPLLLPASDGTSATPTPASFAPRTPRRASAASPSPSPSPSPASPAGATAASLRTLAPFLTVSWPSGSFPLGTPSPLSPLSSTNPSTPGAEAPPSIEPGPRGRSFEDIWSTRARELFRSLREALAPLPDSETTDEETVRRRRREALRIIRELATSNPDRNHVEAVLIQSASIGDRRERRGSSRDHRPKEKALPGLGLPSQP
jgi:hypothetical protein